MKLNELRFIGLIRVQIRTIRDLGIIVTQLSFHLLDVLLSMSNVLFHNLDFSFVEVVWSLSSL